MLLRLELRIGVALVPQAVAGKAALKAAMTTEHEARNELLFSPSSLAVKGWT